jgi:hypothetical protein
MRACCDVKRNFSESWIAAGQNIFDLPNNTELFETVHISTNFVGTNMKRTPRTQSATPLKSTLNNNEINIIRAFGRLVLHRKNSGETDETIAETGPCVLINALINGLF